VVVSTVASGYLLSCTKKVSTWVVIEVFYNQKRRHGYQGNTSPAVFEKWTCGVQIELWQVIQPAIDPPSRPVRRIPYNPTANFLMLHA
jgi:hypothetical protein